MPSLDFEHANELRTSLLETPSVDNNFIPTSKSSKLSSLRSFEIDARHSDGGGEKGLELDVRSIKYFHIPCIYNHASKPEKRPYDRLNTEDIQDALGEDETIERVREFLQRMKDKSTYDLQKRIAQTGKLDCISNCVTNIIRNIGFLVGFPWVLLIFCINPMVRVCTCCCSRRLLKLFVSGYFVVFIMVYAISFNCIAFALMMETNECWAAAITYITVYAFFMIIPQLGFREKTRFWLALIFRLRTVQMHGTTAHWMLPLVCTMGGSFSYGAASIVKSVNNAFSMIAQIFAFGALIYNIGTTIGWLLIRTDPDMLTNIEPDNVLEFQIRNLFIQDLKRSKRVNFAVNIE